MTILFRPITANDQPFLLALYATTRAEEMALVDWSEQQKKEFIEMQFHAQHDFYQQQFCDAQFDLILQGDVEIGRLYLDRQKDEMRIIDIALLPEYRGQGVGAQLLQSILDEAKAVGKVVTIHVEKNNPALSLYERLNFQKIEDQGVYNLMRWQAD